VISSRLVGRPIVAGAVTAAAAAAAAAVVRMV